MEKYIYAKLRPVWLDNYVYDEYIEGYLDITLRNSEFNEEVQEEGN